MFRNNIFYKYIFVTKLIKVLFFVFRFVTPGHTYLRSSDIMCLYLYIVVPDWRARCARRIPPYGRRYKTGDSARWESRSGAFDSSTSRSSHWTSSGLVAVWTGAPMAELPRDDDRLTGDYLSCRPLQGNDSRPGCRWMGAPMIDIRVPDTVTSGVPDHPILGDALTSRGWLSGHPRWSVSQPVYRWTGAPVIGPRASSTVVSGVPDHPTPDDASTWNVGSPDRSPIPDLPDRGGKVSGLDIDRDAVP